MSLESEERRILFCPSVKLDSGTSNWTPCPYVKNAATGCFRTAEECMEHIRHHHPRSWSSLTAHELRSLAFHYRAESKVQIHVENGTTSSIYISLPAGRVQFAHPPGPQARNIETTVPTKAHVHACKHASMSTFGRQVSFEAMGRCNMKSDSKASPIFATSQHAKIHGNRKHPPRA